MGRIENPGALAGATAAEKPIQAITDGSHSNATSRGSRQHHETADHYFRLVAQLNAEWRVIVCKDGIQFVLQKRDARRSGQPRWAGRSYHRDRKSLIRVSRALCGPIDAKAMAVLENLPDWIGDKS